MADGRCDHAEIDTLAGVACGPRLPEQWGMPSRVRGPADFYDVKSDLEALFVATGCREAFVFEPACIVLPAPGRAAPDAARGRDGRLHRRAAPALVRELDFTYSPVLFELDWWDLVRFRSAGSACATKCVRGGLCRSMTRGETPTPRDLALSAGAARHRGGGRRIGGFKCPGRPCTLQCFNPSAETSASSTSIGARA